MARVREQARNPYDMRWGDDLDALLVRYGWEVGWQRQERGPGDFAMRGGAIGQHHPYTLPYVPSGEAWRDPAASEGDDWNPGSRLRPRTGYAPRYAPVFLPAEGELSVLPRGDRFTVDAMLDLPEDTTYHAGHEHAPLPVPAPFQGMPPRRGLYLVPVEGDSVRGITGPAEGGPLVLEVPAGRYLASLEVWAPELGRAGRLRRGLVVAPTPPDVPTLSDLLLASARGDEPTTVEEVLERLLPRAVVHPGDTVRVAWEIHGLGWRRESLSYRLSLTRDQGGLLRAAGRALGVIGDPPSVTLDWLESGPPAPGRILRSVLLTVPRDAEPGAYRLRLEVGSTGRDPLVSERSLEVAHPGSGRR
jgi:hypothetical protein